MTSREAADKHPSSELPTVPAADTDPNQTTDVDAAGESNDDRTQSGQVIGTGSFTLLDGSAIRTPGSGVFTAKGENIENYGVLPDIQVDNTPTDFLAGHDRQIEKAIETLRGEIK